jgi:hypothetical protein
MRMACLWIYVKSWENVKGWRWRLTDLREGSRKIWKSYNFSYEGVDRIQLGQDEGV